jgi:hypothetical protein
MLSGHLKLPTGRTFSASADFLDGLAENVRQELATLLRARGAAAPKPNLMGWIANIVAKVRRCVTAMSGGGRGSVQGVSC